MTFLAPSFLAIGAGLMAIPILIHILNRRRFKTVEWAAMQYLLAAMKSNRRRLRFESLILLIARCACLLLLGLVIARPLGCVDSKWNSLAARQGGLQVLVIDDSYSMAYEANRADAKTHLDQAKKLARQLLSRLAPGAHEVAIITASKPARIFLRPTFDLDAAADAVDRIPQSFSSTDLATALRLTDELGQAAKDKPAKVLHLLTDGTNSSLRSDTQLPAVAKSAADQFRLVVYQLGLANQWNQSVLTLGATDSLVRVGFGSDLQATLGGYGGGETQLEWKLDGKTLPGSSTVRPDSTVVPITQSQASFDKPGPIVAEAMISSNDRLSIDDIRRQVIDVVGDMKVLIVEGKRGIGALTGSGSFLRLALAPPVDPAGGNTSTRYVTPTNISDLELAGTVLSDYRAIVLAGVGTLSAETATSLRQYVENGGSLVMFMGEAVSANVYNNTLGAQGLTPGLLVARVDATGAGATFDFDPAAPHPLLAAFRNIEKSGLDTTQVLTYWRVEPDARRHAQIALRFRPATSDAVGDPAITVQDVGRGRVVFIATSADADWSTLVAKPAYVTLVHELLGGAVGGGERWMNIEAGNVLELPTSLNLTAPPILKENDQRAMTLDRVDRGDGVLVWRSTPILKPGLYHLESGDQRWPIAVNVPADEADVRTVEPAGIQTALGDVEMELLGGDLLADTDQRADSRSGADLSWPILLLVLPLLFAESLMAWRFSRGRGNA